MEYAYLVRKYYCVVNGVEISILMTNETPHYTVTTEVRRARTAWYKPKPKWELISKFVTLEREEAFKAWKLSLNELETTKKELL